MDKEFLYSKIMEVIFNHQDVHEWMEIYRKMSRLSRSEYWLVVKAAIDQMKSCHYEDYSNLTVEEIVKYRDSPLYYTSSDKFEFYLSKLEEYLDFLLKKHPNENVTRQKNRSKKNQPSLKLRQIALLHYYEGNPITLSNGDEIADNFGHSSGRRLYQLYNYYCNTTDRRGIVDESKAKQRNKILLFKSVIDLLSDEK